MMLGLRPAMGFPSAAVAKFGIAKTATHSPTILSKLRIFIDMLSITSLGLGQFTQTSLDAAVTFIAVRLIPSTGKHNRLVISEDMVSC